MNFCAIILPVCVVLVQNHDYYYVFATKNTCCKMLRYNENRNYDKP